MERIWAPWRKAYILQGEPKGCIFCVKHSENRDRKNHILVREERSFALLNLFPYNSGHLMVAPVRHVGELDDLAEEELRDLFLLVRRCRGLLDGVMKPHGFNIGMNLGRTAGAGIVDHLHVHVVPRWEGDTNFMPVVADTKVMPQSLDDLYGLLRKALGCDEQD